MSYEQFQAAVIKEKLITPPNSYVFSDNSDWTIFGAHYSGVAAGVIVKYHLEDGGLWSVTLPGPKGRMDNTRSASKLSIVMILHGMEGEL